MGVKLAVVSTYPPRRCGLATFAAHLRRGLLAAGAQAVPVVALVRQPGDPAQPEVMYQLPQDDEAAYREAARALDAAGVDAVLLQHEYGIFGGPAGRAVLGLLAAVKAPVITTLHTVLTRPSPDERSVLAAVAAYSRAVVVMARRAVSILREVYSVPEGKIACIPHGVPLPAPGTPAEWKRRLGLEGRTVAMTFGLLGPGKGIELALEAVARAVRQCPDLLYLVVGATHPEVLRHEGERYRQGLEERVRSLGLVDHVRFVNRYLEEEELLGYLQACDLYITPYPGQEQICSGTLTYALALGKPVVSTPYAYAQELLGGGAGVLVPFGDTGAMAQAVASLARDPALRRRLTAAALERTRGFVWEQVGAQYLALATGAAVGAPRAAAVPGNGATATPAAAAAVPGPVAAVGVRRTAQDDGEEVTADADGQLCPATPS